MKHIFILNPTAASGKTQKIKNILEKYCIDNNLDYEIIETQYSKHASEIANQYGINDDVTLYSIGGDGTAFEILNGVNDKVSVSIIPAGTGNDFFRMISDDNSDILQTIIECIHGRNVYVDYGVANKTRFLNSTTLGLDARINTLACEIFKKSFMPKKFLYGIASSIGVLAPKPFNMTLTIDDKIIKQKSLLVGVMNGKFYGNGVNPIQDVSIQDGYFDIIVIDNIPVFKLLTLLPKYLSGNTKTIKEIHIYRGKKIKIETEIEIDAQSDGENFKTKSITFDIMKDSLNLRVPMSSKLK